jgi:hypothetical protein
MLPAYLDLGATAIDRGGEIALHCRVCVGSGGIHDTRGQYGNAKSTDIHHGRACPAVILAAISDNLS